MRSVDPVRTSYYAPILVGSLLFSFIMLLVTNIVDEFVPMSPELTGGLSILTALAMGVPTTYAVYRVVNRWYTTSAAAIGATCLLLSTTGDFLEHFSWTGPLRAIPLFNIDHALAFPLQNALLLIGILFFHAALAMCVFAIERDRAALRKQEQRLNETLSELRQQRKTAQEYVDIVGVALIAMDARQRITMVNPCCLEMLGYEEGELVGREVVEALVPGKLHGEVRRELARVFSGDRDERETVLCKVRTKEGEERIVNWANRILRDERGSVRGFLCSGTDITDQSRLERQMQQAQKLESLGVLAGGIAHDFNNLLVGVIGNLDLALTANDHEPIDVYMEDARMAGKRAVELTQQMLAYAGRSTFRLRAVDLPALVQDTGALLQVSLPKKVSLRYEFAEGLPPVYVDQAQIRQVIMNLITNAGEAIGDAEGEVVVRAHGQRIEKGDLDPGVLGRAPDPGSYVLLEVRDTGVGMTDDTLRRIFEPFYSTKFPGRGLGLAAVLGIVRAHGGGLEVKTSPGSGTTFSIYLPEGYRDDTPYEAPTPPELRLSPSATTVLVVDDEPIVRRTLSKLLRGEGYEVVSACDGEEGLERFSEHKHRIRAVLLDLMMPRMDGRETYEVLREISPALPIVVLSGYDAEETAVSFPDDPATTFMQKPFEQEELLQEVARLTLPVDAHRAGDHV